ncbi:iron ABC transporter permease [Lentzea sp. NBRC 105346]|uniref:FecCD family ABC transporter permease n=1 Tax=Lentzea sp. NBRC 105346 TaxID=3032205 RepID=UPI0024A477BE|nr:iron ABC transporter permease [Lentzea sp. NBRC 105346]GLZ30079.1 iron ABC transporter permease [Lentzea sp. NBRC 105346]
MITIERPQAKRFIGVPGMPSPLRSAVFCAVAFAALLAMMVLALSLGDVRFTPAEVIAGAFQQADGGTNLIIFEFRLPRVLAGALAGGCLAASGALLQGLLRNPLASPDVVGVSHGASAGAVLSIAAGVPAALVPLGVFGGALAAAAALVLLAWRKGLDGERIVLVGIGLSAIALTVITWAVVTFPLSVAQQALLWTTGSLAGRTWAEVGVATVAALVILPFAFGQLQRLAVLELGDDLAHSVGLPPNRARLLLLVTAVGLAATGVALAGPVAFIALGVPHLARACSGPTKPGTPSGGILLLGALFGAVLVVGSDLIATSALARPIPVGVVTATLGAPWFCWVLLRSTRKERTAA